jgi:xanthine dehydrogenase accessory factor
LIAVQSLLKASDPLAAALELRARGVPFVLATVVRAVAPTSAKPGDTALLTEDGLVAGWVGGSCAEPIVRRESAAALHDGECRLLHITPEPGSREARPGMSVHAMECYSGGALEIYLEPFLPMPALLVVGNSPVALALCDLGRAMKYRVLVVDLGDRPPMGPDLDVIRDLAKLPPLDGASTFAVVSSHGVFDQESLARIVDLDLAYVGFVASRKRKEEVFAALRARGVAEDRLAKVIAPAGLDLGARLPHEIAVSVFAQIVSVRRSARATVAAVAEVAAVPMAVAAPAGRTAPAPRRGLAVASNPAPAAAPKSCCHGEPAKSE